MSGRTVLITGASTGIGLATAKALAARGGRLFLACRSAAKGRAAVAEVVAASGNHDVDLLDLDLADLASVDKCARDFASRGEPLHVLVNNAGVAGHRGLTEDGFELTFGVNHLGHFALTMGLLDLLVASGPSRVVNVSSDAHYSARTVDFGALRRVTRPVTGYAEYRVSKLCNVLFTQELARRLAGTGVTAYCVHPGVVASDIWRKVPWPVRPLMTRFMIDTDRGAETSVYCAASPEVASASGLFYDRCREREASPRATRRLAEELWAHSEQWTGQR
ncbi:SDR family oxidoreductase [Umezawaea tangerina]|nr:SDR family oxidoreductase [Umezawaea tangerina]